MKILIAHDGSLGADEAINELPRAGMPREAEALFIRVKELWLPHFARMPETDAVATSVASSSARAPRKQGGTSTVAASARVNILEVAVERLRSMFPDWKSEILEVSGSASNEILQQAKVWNADLVVLGSNGNIGFKRYILGSVAQKIANEASCSVRIVRGECWKNGSPNRLLIALDGTDSAMDAVKEVSRRMWSMGSEVRLVLVKDDPRNDPTSIHEYIEDAKKILAAVGLTVTELIEEGDPKQLIVSAAEEWGADCIFLGANESGSAYENFLLGGVSTAVVSRAHCTVEIVRKKINDKT